MNQVFKKKDVPTPMGWRDRRRIMKRMEVKRSQMV